MNIPIKLSTICRGFLTIAIILAGFQVKSVIAETADGLTPAEEETCGFLMRNNDYSHSAYGQCVSYCEARDCEGVVEGDPKWRSCQQTADKLAGIGFNAENLVCESEVRILLHCSGSSRELQSLGTPGYHQLETNTAKNISYIDLDEDWVASVRLHHKDGACMDVISDTNLCDLEGGCCSTGFRWNDRVDGITINPTSTIEDDPNCGP